MSKRIVNLIKNSNYSEREFQALLSLYKYRCLSFDQIYMLHYAKSKLGTRDVDTGYMRRKMSQFKKDGLIEKMTQIEKDCPPLFSLTTDGIKVVRTYFNLSVDEDRDNGIFATNLSPWRLLHALLPAPVGALAFVKVNCMGADLADISREMMLLWGQCVVYFLVGVWGYKRYTNNCH